MHVDEVDDVVVADAVDEIPQNAAAEKTKGDLDDALAKPQRFSPEKNGCQGEYRDTRQKDAASCEDAPGSTGVAHMDQIQEAGDDHDGIRRRVGAEGYAKTHPVLAQLVGNQNGRGEKKQYTVGCHPP